VTPGAYIPYVVGVGVDCLPQGDYSEKIFIAKRFLRLSTLLLIPCFVLAPKCPTALSPANDNLQKTESVFEALCQFRSQMAQGEGNNVANQWNLRFNSHVEIFVKFAGCSYITSSP